MNVGGLDVFIETVLAIFAATCATLLFSFVAAWYGLRHGAQQDATIQDKLAAMLGGCLVGVAVAAIVGFALQDAAASSGLVADLVLCPIVGSATSYFIARDVASGPEPS
jgi:integral membrane sensor domain MASE1